MRNLSESSFEMSYGLYHDTELGKVDGRCIVFWPLVFVVSICACAASLFPPASAAERSLPRNSLWEVVHNLCVPGQSEHNDPKPCLRVDLTGGVERGFAILRDPRGGTQFLLIPTARISGIESPFVRRPHAANYFADAWEARSYINEALHQTLPRDGIGLAINSALSRSQDQLHIHVSCVRADILEALHKNQEGLVGDRWGQRDISLSGHHYLEMWVTGEHLSPHNPFQLLVERLPDAARHMGDRTLVVVGLTRWDGTKGFVILADEANKESGDLAFGEELLDRSCQIAANGKTVEGLIEPGKK
jgi:CDP-diacylglycerol pyrophosphatase